MLSIPLKVCPLNSGLAGRVRIFEVLCIEALVDPIFEFAAVTLTKTFILFGGCVTKVLSKVFPGAARLYFAIALLTRYELDPLGILNLVVLHLRVLGLLVELILVHAILVLLFRFSRLRAYSFNDVLPRSARARDKLHIPSFFAMSSELFLENFGFDEGMWRFSGDWGFPIRTVLDDLPSFLLHSSFMLLPQTFLRRMYQWVLPVCLALVPYHSALT